mmetsp:Transcript_64450/g.192474  ORF Transcript_64450/g.192474 Transcript_64450/m.192474 type:complete len:104 (+) Transcript_64450:873-1184(+)
MNARAAAAATEVEVLAEMVAEAMGTSAAGETEVAVLAGMAAEAMGTRAEAVAAVVGLAEELMQGLADRRRCKSRGTPDAPWLPRWCQHRCNQRYRCRCSRRRR